MKIQSIKLKNYRQYKDARIDFAYQNDDKLLTIVQGANGSGKTNILNAITWCLYGEELHIGAKYKGLPIINTITLKRMPTNALSEVVVEITMRDSENRQMIFRRTLDCKKLSGKDKYEPIRIPGSTAKAPGGLEVYYQSGRDWSRSQDPEYRVHRMLPKAIQEYFFFDCERLNTYFLSPLPDRIRNEVFKISQLGLFQEVIDHLGKRRAFFARQLKDISPQVDKIQRLIEKERQRYETLKRELGKLQKDRAESEDLERDLQEKLKSLPLGGNQVRELQEKREYLERDLNTLEDEIDELNREQMDFIFTASRTIMAYRAISLAVNMMSEKTGSGEIPPDYKIRFIRKLLDEGNCICGTDISMHGKPRSLVEQTLQQCDEIGEISREIIEENNNLSRMLEAVKHFRQKQQNFSKSIKKKNEKIAELNKSLKRISEQLTDVDDEQVKSLERYYQMIKKKRDGILTDIGMKKAELDSSNKQIKRLEVDFDKEVKKIEKHEGLKRILTFCNTAGEAAELIKNDVMEELRTEIEQKTKDQFFELIWKKENYTDVRIDEHYNISVLDQSGIEAIGTLSAGERQILALSFMAALNTVSGFDAAIIIDTPLGRISREPKLNVATKLPGYLSGKQLCLLVTEEEYTYEVREKLLPNVGKEYQINFEETVEGNRAEVIQYE